MKKFARSYRGIVLLGFVCNLGMVPATAQTVAGAMVPVTAASNTVKPVRHSSRPPKDEQFNSISAAAAHCPHSTVVWSSLGSSHSFHLSSSRWFGKTKHGAYVCEGDAASAGFHQAKS